MSTILRHGAGNPRNSEGSFIELAGGKILFAYTRYNGDDFDDHCPADIYGITSDDCGKSWSKPFLIVKNTSMNVMSVSLLRLHSGRIAMVTLHKSAIPGYPKFRDCRPFIRFSDDEAQSWSEPIAIVDIPPCYIVVNNDRLIQLSSGRLLLPAALCFYGKDGGSYPSICTFFMSDDEGVTWRPSWEICAAPPCVTTGLQEPGIIELKNGAVLAWFRNSGGCQYKAISIDGGDHWSVPVPAVEFRGPGSPLSMKRDPESGDLVAIWNDYHPQRSVKFTDGIMGRSPLVLARSSDEGITWDRHRILEDAPDHGFAYTAMLFTRAKLLLGYCCGGKPECVCMLQDLKLDTIEL